MDEAISSRVIPRELQELLFVYMDFLKQNKDIISEDNPIFKLFQWIAENLCKTDYDIIYKEIIKNLLIFANDIKGFKGPKNLDKPINFMIFGDHPDSLINQITKLNDQKKFKVDDYETIFDAIQLLIDVTYGVGEENFKFQLNFKYVGKEDLKRYLLENQKQYSGELSKYINDVTDCFLDVVKEEHKKFLDILKKKKGSSKAVIAQYNDACKHLYDDFRDRVLLCVENKNPKGINIDGENKKDALNLLWKMFIGSRAINKNELIGNYSDSVKFINMLKRQELLELETTQKSLPLKVDYSQMQPSLDYYDSPARDKIGNIQEESSVMNSALSQKAAIKNDDSNDVIALAFNFKETYDDISSPRFLPIDEILLKGKVDKQVIVKYIQPDELGEKILENIKTSLQGQNISLTEMAQKRKLMLGLETEFMIKMSKALNLIMTQCDLMHDIILKGLTGVWYQCDYIYDKLRNELKDLSYEPENKDKDEYLTQLDLFHKQLEECWSQGLEQKAIQEKLRNLRQGVNNWLLELVKLPKQDFESQLLTREEAIIYCLNFYGEHGKNNFMFRESGRPVLDFNKIKKLVESFDEEEKTNFMEDITPHGLVLLNEILDCSSKQNVDELEETYISKFNTLSSIDGCLKSNFNTESISHIFRDMFGIYDYYVYSSMPNKSGAITAASVGHLIVVTSSMEEGRVVAVFGLVGPVTVNNVFASFYDLGGQVISGNKAGRGKQSGITNLFERDLNTFLETYNFKIRPEDETILRNTIGNLLIQKNPKLCAYFLNQNKDKDIIKPEFNTNEIYLLTLGIKTICDEVLDANVNLKLVITVDSLVWDTIFKKWLMGDKSLLPYVFRSFSKSYFMNAGKLEVDINSVSKGAFLKILKYCQLAKSLSFVNLKLHIFENNISKVLEELSEKFFTEITGSDVKLNNNFIINRYVNTIYRIFKLRDMSPSGIRDNNGFEILSAYIMKINASNVLQTLKKNIIDMTNFLRNYLVDKDILVLIDNINSLAGDQSLLRITQVNVFQESETTYFPQELVDAVGENYGVKIKVVDVTEDNIIFYTGGKTVNLLKALENYDFDLYNIDILCEKSYSGKRVTTSKPITFHALKFTYPIEFLIKLFKSSSDVFEIHDEIKLKIEYFCVKYFVNNYETVRNPNGSTDNDFFEKLSELFNLESHTSYQTLKTSLEEYGVNLEIDPDADADICPNDGKDKSYCDEQFQTWIDDQVTKLIDDNGTRVEPGEFVELFSFVDSSVNDTIQQAINRVSHLIMTNCDTTSKQPGEENEPEINIDNDIEDSDSNPDLQRLEYDFGSPIKKSVFGFETSVSENPVNAGYSPDQIRRSLSELGDQGSQDDNKIKRAKTPEITRNKRAVELSQGFFTTPTKKGGKSSTRGRQSKVKRFTKGRNRKQLNKHKIIRKTKKIYRKKYKTRRH